MITELGIWAPAHPLLGTQVATYLVILGAEGTIFLKCVPTSANKRYTTLLSLLYLPSLKISFFSENIYVSNTEMVTSGQSLLLPPQAGCWTAGACAMGRHTRALQIYMWEDYPSGHKNNQLSVHGHFLGRKNTGTQLHFNALNE